jgi:hypothetical protein
MQKRRIYWPYGNPHFDAWEIQIDAGPLVVRRNHPLARREGESCQGWDLWLGHKYLGAVGSRSLSELATLSQSRLKSLALPACCGRHGEFDRGAVKVSRPGWGGRRANAGRRPRDVERRVELGTTVARQTLELIDRHRGESSRGEFLDRLVELAKLR